MQALILVDIQNDFMPFGSLPVPEGDRVVPVANAISASFDLVVATQDWHPADHASFASNHPGARPGDVVELGGEAQVLWPDHCVQNTPGASFHSALDVSAIDVVVRKGTDPGIDSYSAFFDNHHLKETGLRVILEEHDVKTVTVMGLATDYCVKYTVLDGIAAGFEVRLVRDGCRAVDLTEGDGEEALEQMREAGCMLLDSHDLGIAQTDVRE